MLKWAGALAAGMAVWLGWPVVAGLKLKIVPGPVRILPHIPTFITRWKTRRDQVAFEAQWPDGLDLLSGALRAGSGFLQAWEVLCKESPEPLAGACREALADLRLGVPLTAALSRLTDRFDGEEVRFSVAAVTLARSTGGGLAEVLASCSATVRERARLRAKVASLTAQGRMSGWVVGGMPAALLLVLSLLAPDLVEPLVTTLPGLLTLCVCAVMVAAGAWTIRRIVRIDI